MDNVNERLNMRILQKDKQALKKFANSEGETMSVIIRRLIKKELEEYEKISQQKTNENK